MDAKYVLPPTDLEGPHSPVAPGPEIGVSNHVVKVIEVLAESPHGWQDAAAIALREASRSLHGIVSIYIKDLQAIVRDGQIRAWRVNAKVSFVVNDEDQMNSTYSTHRMGGETTMRNRNQDQGREGYRPSRDESSPDYDDDGLHGQDRRQYRGRESYEQQTRGGQGGRSGMWDHRYIAPDNRENDDPNRNNASEDRRGYQNIGSRQEFESGGRGRPDYYMRWRDEDPRSSFERDRSRGYDRGQNPDYSRDRDDYNRQYGGRQQGGDEWSRRYADDSARTDYGQRDHRSRDPRDYGSPYPQRPSYEEQEYTRGAYSGGNNSIGRGNGQGTSGYDQGRHDQGRHDQGRYDQGRYVSSQYDQQYGQQRRGARGPKGYKRSDDRIREDVCDRLSHQYDVDASEVEVSVSNGEVTLTGTVSDRDQKFRIEHVADGVGGVSEVHNQLRIRRETSSQTSNQGAQNVRPNPSNQSRHS